MLKMRFSELFVIIGIFVIDLALLYQFLRYDTNGTLLCIFIFLSFFALLELCFRRGINPMGLMPRHGGAPCAGFSPPCSFTARGRRRALRRMPSSP